MGSQSFDKTYWFHLQGQQYPSILVEYFALLKITHFAVTLYHAPEESILSYTSKKTFKLNKKEMIVKKLRLRKLVKQTSENESDRDVNLFPFLRQFCVLNNKMQRFEHGGRANDNCLALRRPKFQVLSQKRIFRLIPFVIIYSVQTKA
jgi:hypothetical protein